MNTVLVLGAAGRLGAAVAAAFRDAGWRVKAQVRPGGRSRLAPGLEPVEADGTDRAALARAGADADVVVHAANPPYTRWKREVTPLADGAIAAAAANGALLMLPGNVYNFGRRMPERLATDTPMRPTTTKGRQRVALEDRLAAAARRDGFRLVVIRAGDFFGGEGTGSWFDLVLAKNVARGRFDAPAGPGVPHAWAYLPDLAAAFVAVAGARDRLGLVERLHFPGHTATMEEMQGAMEAALGRPLETRSVPWLLMRVLSPFAPLIRAILEMKYLWDVPHRLVDGRLAEIAGPLPSTPLGDAVAASLAALGHRVAGRDAGEVSR